VPAPVSVIILTFNEQLNVGRALDSVVGWSDDVHIVDSGSTDGTLDICGSRGATIHRHPWEHWAAQRNWSLDNLPLAHEWVLFLDADEWLTDAVKQEMERILPALPREVAGLLMRRRLIFMGRWLRHGGQYAWVLRLMKRRKARYIPAGASEYATVDGEVRRLRHDMVHEDLRGLDFMIAKHNRLSEIQADFEISGERVSGTAGNRFLESEARIGVREKWWSRLPLFVRALLHFIYRYVLRLMFLDGKPGLIYCVIHSFWYYFMIDAKIHEKRLLRKRCGPC
jgi:glycosyltransferase involved in cell wall biosynthesis